MIRRQNVLTISTREARLRRRVREHLRELGFARTPDGLLLPPSLDKSTYRKLHGPQRLERLESEAKFLERSSNLVEHFAEGREVDINRLSVRVELVEKNCWQSELFRFATMLWSVPVSYGFGRRMRYLVWDDHINKLIGLFALGDPVFNLRARDEWVGWSVVDRSKRLVNVMDGYVIGSVPPYNALLGGKLVAALMRTREVVKDFRDRYGTSRGVISGAIKNAHLVAITTTSALGRSSVYNRLRLGNVEYLSSLGYTGGYGHFHFPSVLFDELRDYLKRKRHSYADSHQFGDGPNWRLRTIKQALSLLGLDPNLIRHGLTREVFVSCLADNAVAVLSGKRKRPRYDTLLDASAVSALAIERWLKPRSLREESYKTVCHEDILRQIRRTEDAPGSAIRRAQGG